MESREREPVRILSDYARIISRLNREKLRFIGKPTVSARQDEQSSAPLLHLF